MRVGIAMALVFLSSAAAAAPNADAVAVVETFHAALGRGDAKAAAALLADDAIIFEEGGAERSKAEYAAHHSPADAVFSQAVKSLTTRRSGDAAGEMAWVSSEGRTTGTYKATVTINLDPSKRYYVDGALVQTDGDDYAHVYISTVCIARSDTVHCGIRDWTDDKDLNTNEHLSNASRVTIALRTKGGRHRAEGTVYEL